MFRSLFLSVVWMYSINMFSQYTLTEYSETENKIRMVIELETVKLSRLDDHGSRLAGFTDESRPGEYALPQKEIFVGLPYKKITGIKSSILHLNTYRANLSLSPLAGKENDSVVTYNYNFIRNVRSSSKETVEFKGYLLIDYIHTAHLAINQYRYDEVMRRVEEIIKIEIELIMEGEINGLKVSEEKAVSSIIINAAFADRYKRVNTHTINDSTGGWIDYNKDYLRLTLAADGIYRVRFEDIERYLPAAVDPGSINLYSNGKKIPIYIKNEQEGIFGSGDYIEFYGRRTMGGSHRDVSQPGESYHEYTGKYSDTTVYWLTWNDTGPLRVQLSESNILNSSDTLFYFNEVNHYEINNWFDFSVPDLIIRELPYWQGNKTWGWTSVGVGTKVFNFTAPGVYPGKQLNIYAKLQSYASSVQVNSHLLGIGLNEDESCYDSSFIDKYEQKVLSAVLDSDSLKEGVNKFKLLSFPTASTVNSIFFDWYEIEYPRYLTLINDSLRFTFNELNSPLIRTIRLSGAGSPSYSFWKCGTSFEKYINFDVTSGFICITDTISKEDEFTITESSKIKAPVIAQPARFRNIRKDTGSFDYLIITTETFYNKALEYSHFIKNLYQLNTRVISVEDIYKEFAYGNFNPEAIKDFLIAITHYWTPPHPKYLFLIGDASYDYHLNKYRYQGAPALINRVPSYGAPVSDNWYVIWDTTGAMVPQMNVGRLPVNTIEEFDSYFERHKRYLTRNPDELNKRYIFFSGGNTDNEQELQQLRGVNEIIINSLVAPEPVGGNYSHFYKTLSPFSSFGPYTDNEVQRIIDSSGLFISYIGHSGTQTWDNSIVDPDQLHNSVNASPLITDFGCSTGKFAEPDIISFSELFVADKYGEAIAYIGNSSLGFLSTSLTFPYLFYSKILNDSVYNISEAHRLAKIKMLQTYGGTGVYKLFTLTNTLIGDPVISLPVPQQPNLRMLPSGITLENDYPTSLDNSINIHLDFVNTGKASGDSMQILIKSIYDGEFYFDSLFVCTIPLFTKSFTMSIPIQGKAGVHKVIVYLDPYNQISEIYENDNEAFVIFNVYSAELRLLNVYPFESCIEDTLKILNPSFIKKDAAAEIEIGDDANFSSVVKFSAPVNTPFTYVPLNTLTGKGRKWLRGRILDTDTPSFTFSAVTGEDFNFMLSDSVSYSRTELNNLIVSNSLTPDTASQMFTVISAGFHDGKTAVISRNGHTYVPMGNIIGHHVCVFDAASLNFITYRRFNVFGGGTGETTSYYNFLDTLSQDYLIMAAVSDEGRVADSLALLIKEFGSIYIDSLSFRSSWAFIGRRGALPGSVPEAYGKAYTGRVRIDTALNTPYISGSFVTPVIGPAAEWQYIKIIKNVSAEDEIKIRPIGINSSGITDTLVFLDSDSSSLSDICRQYRFIRLQGLVQSSGVPLPELQMLGVRYTAPAEIITGLVSVNNSDTLLPGNLKITEFHVLNGGDSPADSFTVRGNISGEDNIKKEYALYENVCLAPGEQINFTCSYPSEDVRQNMKLHVSADEENKVFELYKDNNFLTLPFYSAGDTAAPFLRIKFEDRDLLEGDFMPANPVLCIELDDNSLQSFDTPGLLNVRLDGNDINYAGAGDTISVEYGIHPKIKMKYTPHLKPGVHTITAGGEDPSGNKASNNDLTVSFVVSDKIQLLEIYNYPNPFRDDTFFTFRLTGIPENMNIRIYTAAGRLIKKINVPAEQLNYDFNTIYWNGLDEDGNRIANGVYLYKISAGDISAAGKLAKVK